MDDHGSFAEASNPTLLLVPLFQVRILFQGLGAVSRIMILCRLGQSEKKST